MSMKDMVPYAGDVFFRVFNHPLHSFLQCDRLNTMTQRAIIPDSSIISRNSSKWEVKGPHRTLLFSRTSLVNHLMVLKESPVYVFLLFPHTLISQIVYLRHSNFRILLLYVVLIVITSTMSSFVGYRPSNMASFLVIPT